MLRPPGRFLWALPVSLTVGPSQRAPRSSGLNAKPEGSPIPENLPSQAQLQGPRKLPM